MVRPREAPSAYLEHGGTNANAGIRLQQLQREALEVRREEALMRAM